MTIATTRPPEIRSDDHADDLADLVVGVVWVEGGRPAVQIDRDGEAWIVLTTMDALALSARIQATSREATHTDGYGRHRPPPGTSCGWCGEPRDEDRVLQHKPTCRTQRRHDRRPGA